MPRARAVIVYSAMCSATDKTLLWCAICVPHSAYIFKHTRRHSGLKKLNFLSTADGDGNGTTQPRIIYGEQASKLSNVAVCLAFLFHKDMQ